MFSTDVNRRSSEAFYQITVHGELSQNVMEYFEGMKIESIHNEMGEKTTVLAGKVKDQGELIGILNKLYDFHYFINSVQYAEGKD